MRGFFYWYGIISGVYLLFCLCIGISFVVLMRTKKIRGV